MASPEEFLTASVDDYLIGLAESVQHAQEQLNQMSVVVQDNQPPVRYHLPRVDFEMKVSFELARNQDVDEKDVVANTNMILRARPVGGQTSTQSSTAEAASVIKGSFVAVPSEGGKPLPVIGSSLRRLSARALEVSISVQSTAGEKLSGINVQFNVDQDTSNILNQLVNLKTLNAKTCFDNGMVLTNKEGLAVSTLRVAEDEHLETHVAMVIDVLGKTETIIFKVDK